MRTSTVAGPFNANIDLMTSASSFLSLTSNEITPSFMMPESDLTSPAQPVLPISSPSFESLATPREVTSETLPTGSESAAYEILTGPEALTATTVIYTTVCIFSVVGIFTNLVNIMVFIRMGLNKETINVGFCALSVADLFTLISLFLLGLVNCPLWPYLNIPMGQYDATLLLTGPFMSASSTSHCITALISLERCVCVVLPLKVKSIFTMRRVRIAVVTIWAVIMLGALPKYATTYIRWREQPGTNASLLVFEYTPLMREVETVTIQVMNVFIPLLMYLFVVVCTAFLVTKLRQASERRRFLKKEATALTSKSKGAGSQPGQCSSSFVSQVKTADPSSSTAPSSFADGNGTGNNGTTSTSDQVYIDAPDNVENSGVYFGETWLGSEQEKDTGEDLNSFTRTTGTNRKKTQTTPSSPGNSHNRKFRAAVYAPAYEAKTISPPEAIGYHHVTNQTTDTTLTQNTNATAAESGKKTPRALTNPQEGGAAANQGTARQAAHQARDEASARELRVVKFVVIICAIFLTCTSPTMVLILISLVWPKFHVNTPEFKNLMYFLISFPFLTQSISSSINIVFYMRMSSRFRPACMALFRSRCCGRAAASGTQSF